jgi:integrase
LERIHATILHLSPVVADMIRMQLLTGMRPGEVCGLRWCDLHQDYLLPTVGINRYGNETDLKNEKAHEKVFLDPFVSAYLDKLKTAHKSMYLAYGVPFTEQSYINCIPTDMRQMSPEYLGKAFDRICKRNNLDRIRLYDSRHSLGTNMMRDGVNPKVVSEVMRHESVKTTLDIYSHVDDDLKKEMM